MSLVTGLAEAAANTVAAIVTGFASMLTEVTPSWADTGDAVFLFVAERRSVRPPDAQHLYRHRRAAYTWSLFAAFGLFACLCSLF